MQKIRIAAMGVATLAIALAAAQYMQSHAGGSSAVNHAKPAPVTTTPLGKAETLGRLAVSDVTLTSALPSAPRVAQKPVSPLPAVASGPAPEKQTTLPTLPREENAPALTCEQELNVTPLAAAMVRLELSAHCLANERFTLHHNGLMVTAITDDEGRSELIVPALSAEPVFIVAFMNGEGAVATAKVPEFTQYDRVVVQWKGQSGLQLHAREGGADYGSDGHVWAEAPRDMTTGAGGFLVRLGDARAAEPLMADVYSYPTGTNPDAQVTLSVEAQVTQANCMKDVEAQTLEFPVNGKTRSQDLILSIPDCDAAGDFLVLKNLLNDLKVAAR